MGTVYKEFTVNADPDFVWQALRDVGALHKRIARGFVVNSILEGDIRTVTFSNGFVARERIVSIDNAHRRLACSAVGGLAAHHHASFQVLDAFDGNARVRWITDILPDEMLPMFEQMVEDGAQAMKQTLEKSYRSAEALEGF